MYEVMLLIFLCINLKLSWSCAGIKKWDCSKYGATQLDCIGLDSETQFDDHTTAELNITWIGSFTCRGLELLRN